MRRFLVNTALHATSHELHNLRILAIIDLILKGSWFAFMWRSFLSTIHISYTYRQLPCIEIK